MDQPHCAYKHKHKNEDDIWTMRFFCYIKIDHGCFKTGINSKHSKIVLISQPPYQSHGSYMGLYLSLNQQNFLRKFCSLENSQQKRS